MVYHKGSKCERVVYISIVKGGGVGIWWEAKACQFSAYSPRMRCRETASFYFSHVPVLDVGGIGIKQQLAS